MLIKTFCAESTGRKGVQSAVAKLDTDVISLGMDIEIHLLSDTYCPGNEGGQISCVFRTVVYSKKE